MARPQLRLAVGPQRGCAHIEKARGKREQVGEITAARIAQQGNFIDLDGEVGHEKE